MAMDTSTGKTAKRILVKALDHWSLTRLHCLFGTRLKILSSKRRTWEKTTRMPFCKFGLAKWHAQKVGTEYDHKGNAIRVWLKGNSAVDSRGPLASLLIIGLR